MSVIAAVCLVFVSSSHVFSEQIVIDSDRQFHHGRTLMERGEYENAIYEFERFMHLFPGDSRVVKASFLKGICYLKAQKFDSAREVFFKIAREGQGSDAAGRALLLIGESYYQQGVFSEAEHYLVQTIETTSCGDLKDMAYYRLGWTRMQTGRWLDASGAFKQVGRGALLYESALALAEQSLDGEKIPRKKPALAGTLAAIVPGSGHAYVNRYRDAATAFILNGLFVWATVESFQQDHEVLGCILGIIELGWYTGNIYSAVNCTHKYNRHVKGNFVDSLKDQFDLGVFASGKGHVGLALTFKF